MTVFTYVSGVLVPWFAAAWRIICHAPWLLLPILLTEGAQHVAEIQLGMFASRGDFIALSDDATRMAFGNAKIAGLLLSLLLVLRAVALGSALRALRFRWAALVLFAVMLLLTYALDLAFQSEPARKVAPDLLLKMINILIQTLLLVPLLAALFEDDWVTIRRAGWKLIPAIFLAVALAALAVAPMQWLHMANHVAALGASTPVVWALMIFDTIWVALLALMVGSALALGWRSFVGEPVSRRSTAD